MGRFGDFVNTLDEYLGGRFGDFVNTLDQYLVGRFWDWPVFSGSVWELYEHFRPRFSGSVWGFC